MAGGIKRLYCLNISSFESIVPKRAVCLKVKRYFKNHRFNRASRIPGKHISSVSGRDHAPRNASRAFSFRQSAEPREDGTCSTRDQLPALLSEKTKTRGSRHIPRYMYIYMNKRVFRIPRRGNRSSQSQRNARTVRFT